MQRAKIGETILFVGQNSELLSRLYDAFPKHMVAASSDRLSDLATTPGQLAERHSIVMFETDANPADIEALAKLTGGEGGKPVFLALIDEDLPIGKAQKLFQAGVEVLPVGSSEDALSTSLSRLMGGNRKEAAAPLPAPRGAVYSVVPTRGGAGATTVAVNLATSLAAGLPKSTRDTALVNQVVLLDLDIQFGNAGTYVDLEDNGAMTDLLAGGMPPPDRILRAVQDSGLAFDVLTAPAIFVPVTAMTAELAQQIVETLRTRYDHVVIDLPRAALDWVEPVIAATDRMLLVSDSSVPCIRQAKRLHDLFRETRTDLPIDLVMNRERRSWFGDRNEKQREAEDLLQIRIDDWLVDDAAGERRAIDLGHPSSSTRSRNRNNYRRLARRLLSSGGDINQELER